MDYKNFSAKTVDEAITKACLELGVTSDRLDYEVMSEGSNGFLGIGSKPASIKARKRSEEELAREAAAIEAAEKAAAQSVVFVQEKKPEKKEEKKVVTSDEIEKRAALAAAKAKEEGIYPESSEYGKRTDREAPRNGRRHDDRRDGKFESRRDSRHDDKRNGKYDSRRNSHDRRSGYVPEETVTADEKPHKPSQPKPDRVISPKTDEEVEKMKSAADDFLTNVFKSMGTDVKMEMDYDQKEGCLNCTFSGDEMGILIGKRGQTLDSLHYLTSLVINKGENEYTRVKLDTEDYRARRADTLENLSRNIAYKVRKSHKAVALEPMNPYERRIIHSALQDSEYVETYSEGEEPYRHVVVAPKSGK